MAWMNLGNAKKRRVSLSAHRALLTFLRTVQRWEKQIELPIHRVRTSGPVVALVEELDAWEQSRPTHLIHLIDQLRTKVERLEAEVLSPKTCGSRFPSIH